MRLKYLIALLLIILIGACQFSDGDIKYNFGNDFISDPTNVIMVDTLTVNTFTISSDTFSTSQANRLLVGSSTNDYGIETYCEAYFRFNPSGFINVQETTKYDSICFVFNLDGYRFGDTTIVSEFEVYRLVEDIEVNEDSYKIYNDAQFASEDEPLCSFKIDYNEFDSEVIMRLPDELGEELYQLNVNESDTLVDVNLFKDFFKGFVIKPVDNQASFVFGIEAIADSVSAPEMRIYYSDFTTVDGKYFSFPIGKNEYTTVNNIYAFSHIVNNIENSVLSELESIEDKISSTATNDISFMQGGSMLYTRIEIPYIDNLYDFGLGTILKAELYFEPIEETFEDKSDLASNLQMYIIEENNELFEPLYVVEKKELAIGTLVYGNEFKEDTKYTFDITNFVKTEYEELAGLEYALMLTTPYDSSLPSVDQLIIGSSDNIKNRMKLKVYITKF